MRERERERGDERVRSPGRKHASIYRDKEDKPG